MCLHSVRPPMTMPVIFGLTLTLLTCLHPVYLQHFNNSESCSTATFAAEKVSDFWPEATLGCEIEVKNLIKIHKKILLNKAQQNKDQISDLVDGHIRSALTQYLFDQLIALVSTKSLSSRTDVQEVFDQLYNEQDRRLLLEVWQKVLDETFLFMSADDILQQLLEVANGDLKLNLLHYLLKKYENQSPQSYKFLPLLTFGVSAVIKQRLLAHEPLADPDIGRLMAKLPQQLLTIFQSWNYNVSVLNVHANDYIFSERNNGVAANKRFLFSFLPAKNTFRVKGKFKMQISASGLITLGAPYAHSYSYLTAEAGSAFICLNCALTAAQWWQVLWLDHVSRSLDQQFVLFQNLATGELLCSTSISDKDLILISTADLQNHINDSHCHWKVVKRTK